MSKQAKRLGYVVTLRAPAGWTEDEKLRALRALLKNALRSYDLRCTSCVPESDAETTAEVTR